jgi:hypothetical protein
MNIKKFATTYIGIITISSIAIFLLIGLPYFTQFKQSQISNSTQDWGAFGSYISGIAAILNLLVFIILTIYIAKLGNANSKEQVVSQKKIIISQFRQAEIDKINDQLDAAFRFKGNESKGELINIYTTVSIYLTNFLNQKKYLFPILNDNLLKNRIDILLSRYSQMATIVEEIHGVPVEKIEEEKNKKLETKIQFSISIKNEIIDILQQFILDELEK